MKLIHELEHIRELCMVGDSNEDSILICSEMSQLVEYLCTI